MANVLLSAAVTIRTCTVSVMGPSAIRHSVDLTAKSADEAAAFGASALRKSGPTPWHWEANLKSA